MPTYLSSLHLSEQIQLSQIFSAQKGSDNRGSTVHPSCDLVFIKLQHSYTVHEHTWTDKIPL